MTMLRLFWGGLRMMTGRYEYLNEILLVKNSDDENQTALNWFSVLLFRNLYLNGHTFL